MAAIDLILEDTAQSGAWNMAMDEALLEAAVQGASPVLRWYQWNAATLSLGYFQDLDECQKETRWAGLPVVRRLSGGGAILHHHEWTYSCVLPADHPLTNDAYQIYIAIHKSLIKVLNEWGFAARLRATRFGKDGPAEAFLCFSRGDEMDVVIDDHKIIGSAQRRRKGAVLQHGSIVLQRSEFAPEFPGLFDFRSCSEPQKLSHQLAQSVANALGAPCLPTTPSDAVIETANRFYQDRYTTLGWGRKNPLQQKTD